MTKDGGEWGGGVYDNICGGGGLPNGGGSHFGGGGIDPGRNHVLGFKLIITGWPKI